MDHCFTINITPIEETCNNLIKESQEFKNITQINFLIEKMKREMNGIRHTFLEHTMKTTDKILNNRFHPYHNNVTVDTIYVADRWFGLCRDLRGFFKRNCSFQCWVGDTSRFRVRWLARGVGVLRVGSNSSLPSSKRRP